MLRSCSFFYLLVIVYFFIQNLFNKNDNYLNIEAWKKTIGKTKTILINIHEEEIDKIKLKKNSNTKYGQIKKKEKTFFKN